MISKSDTKFWILFFLKNEDKTHSSTRLIDTLNIKIATMNAGKPRGKSIELKSYESRR